MLVKSIGDFPEVQRDKIQEIERNVTRDIEGHKHVICSGTCIDYL